MAFRPPDQEGEITPLTTPMLHTLGQLFGRVGLAGDFQRNDMAILRHCGQHALAFVIDGALCIAALASQAGLYFDEFQRQPVRQPFLVFSEPLRYPTWRALAGGDESRFH